MRVHNRSDEAHGSVTITGNSELAAVSEQDDVAVLSVLFHVRSLCVQPFYEITSLKRDVGVLSVLFHCVHCMCSRSPRSPP